MKKAVRAFLADESRAQKIIVNARVGVMTLGLVVAVAAVVLMS
jgi:hypothetical protein